MAADRQPDQVAATRLLDRILGRRVDPSECEIVKLLPTSPPLRGTVVLVDGVRCRVTRAKVTWEGRVWTVRSLRVKEAESNG